MRKFSVLFIAIVLTVSFAFNLFASNGSQIGTVGARSTAMGSNFRGLANDWSAFFFNPAGLTQLDNKWTIGGSLGLIMPRGSYSPISFPQNVTPFPGLYTDQRDLDKQNFPVPSIGIFYKVNDWFTAGIGFAGPFGLGAKFDLINIPSAYENNAALDETFETQSDHQVVNVQPTFAFKITDQLSVGVGIGYIGLLNGIESTASYMKIRQVGVPDYGVVIQGMEAEGGLPAGSYQNYQQLVALLSGQVLPIPSMYDDVKSRLIVENYLDGSEGQAWAFSFGLHYKPMESLGIGISGRLYTDLKLEGAMTRKIHYPGGASTFITNLRPTFPLMAATGQDTSALKAGIMQTFSGTTQTITYDASADLPLPMTLGIGVAYSPVSRLTLTADVSFTRWSTWDIIEAALTNQADGSEETLAFKEDWKDTFEYGAGAEFCLFSTESMKLALRGGFYMVATPTPDETISPTILDPNNRTVLTGGIGFSLGMLSFDLSYENILFGDRDVQTWLFEPELGNSNGNWAGVYKLNASVITVEASIGL